MEVPMSVAIARSMHQAQAVARRGPDESPSTASLYDKHLAQIEAERSPPKRPPRSAESFVHSHVRLNALLTRSEGAMGMEGKADGEHERKAETGQGRARGGCGVVKIKVGGAGSVLEQAVRVREMIGRARVQRQRVRLDANQCWTLPEAVAFVEALGADECAAVDYIEEPLVDARLLPSFCECGGVDTHLWAFVDSYPCERVCLRACACMQASEVLNTQEHRQRVRWQCLTHRDGRRRTDRHAVCPGRDAGSAWGGERDSSSRGSRLRRFRVSSQGSRTRGAGAQADPVGCIYI